MQAIYVIVAGAVVVVLVMLAALVQRAEHGARADQRSDSLEDAHAREQKARSELAKRARGVELRRRLREWAARRGTGPGSGPTA